jgi:hypothetical protein
VRAKACRAARRFEGKRLARERMDEGEPPRVQRLARQIHARLDLSVDGIVDDRMPEGREVDPDLVRTSRLENERQFAVAVQFFVQLVVRDGRFAVGADRVFEAVVRIAAERSFDRPLRMRGCADHEAEVAALELAAH